MGQQKIKPVIIFTIDVETPQTPLREGKINELLFEAKYKNENYGISLINKLLNNESIYSTNFVNVYESALWGENKIKNFCKEIINNGNEIGLHTHPEWVFEKEKLLLNQYSEPDQVRIINYGLDLLRKWLPNTEIYSHRGGAYGINNDTFSALVKNDIFFDSSVFFSHPNCESSITKNKIVNFSGVIEIPVTNFTRLWNISLGKNIIKKKKVFSKTDISHATYDEIINYVNIAIKKNISLINIFLHSYTLLSFNKNYKKYEPDFKTIEKFKRIIQTLKNNDDIRIMKIEDLAKNREITNELISKGNEYTPEFNVSIPLQKAIIRKLF